MTVNRDPIYAAHYNHASSVIVHTKIVGRAGKEPDVYGNPAGRSILSRGCFFIFIYLQTRGTMMRGENKGQVERDSHVELKWAP